MSKSEKNSDNNQTAIEFSYFNITAEINRLIAKGYRYVDQFKKHSSDNMHIVIFEKPNSNDKNTTIPVKRGIRK